MGTLIKDPNAPPDPNEVAAIPDTQYPGGPPDHVGEERFNPTTPGVPPSADYPVGIPPDTGGEETPPSEPQPIMPAPDPKLRPQPVAEPEEAPEKKAKKK